MSVSKYFYGYQIVLTMKQSSHVLCSLKNELCILYVLLSVNYCVPEKLLSWWLVLALPNLMLELCILICRLFK